MQILPSSELAPLRKVFSKTNLKFTLLKWNLFKGQQHWTSIFWGLLKSNIIFMSLAEINVPFCLFFRLILFVASKSTGALRNTRKKAADDLLYIFCSDPFSIEKDFKNSLSDSPGLFSIGISWVARSGRKIKIVRWLSLSIRCDRILKENMILNSR